MDISEVGGSNQEGNMEEDSRRNGSDGESEVTIPMSGISIQSTTDISIPVPNISFPIPVPSISVHAPNSGNISIPVPSNLPHPSYPVDTKLRQSNNPIPQPMMSYITDHPLISKTAYETAV